MKTNLTIRFSILIFLAFANFPKFAWGQHTGTSTPYSPAACIKSAPDKITCDECCAPLGKVVGGGGTTPPATDPLYLTCTQNCSSKFGNSATGACETAYKDWQTTAKANGNACKSFMNGTNSGKTCDEVVESCRDQVNTAFASNSDPNSIDELLNLSLNTVKAFTGKDPSAPAMTKSANPACYGFTNKEIRDAKKDHDKSIKDIKDAIKKAQEKINDSNKKLRDEVADVKKEQAELTNSLKEAQQGLDVKKREQNTKINEELQAAATAIRQKTQEIIKVRQASNKAKFQHQAAMLNFSEDKINTKCKTALDTAKRCFIKNSKGQPGDAKDACANEVYAFTGKGAKGTTELKQKLQQVKDNCFEAYDQSVKTTKYDFEETIKNYDMDIEQKQADIADANTALESKRKENESVAKEIDEEKTQKQSDFDTKVANLSAKLAETEKSIQETIATENAEMNDLNEQLNKLTAVSLTADLGIGAKGSTNEDQLNLIFTQAQNAIEANENARVLASESCGCETTTAGVTAKKSDARCAALIQSGSAVKATPKTRAKTKTKTGQ